MVDLAVILGREQTQLENNLHQAFLPKWTSRSPGSIFAFGGTQAGEINLLVSTIFPLPSTLAFFYH